ncbi:hypothetical protein LWM68_18765 [Niabella sp. W65]|nr:hypothetical protein [Niabella sp. W65]MCH7364616.1 hypothetical protein [Niabella sp. W65]ULT40470.1 hypothetical protein KRR40_37665 [Niabella sp. I65]
MKRNIYNPHNDFIKEDRPGVASGSNEYAIKIKTMHWLLPAVIIISACLLSMSCNKDFLEKPNGALLQ